MGERRVRRLPILDAEGRLVGIVTERDLHRVVFEGRGVTVGPAADLCEAARRMDEHRIGAVPVVEDARLLGMLTRTDVVQGLVARVSSPPGAAPGRST
jgi:CBS domain-containing protein